MYIKHAFHISGKGAAVFADGLTAAVDSAMGNITNIFGITFFLNRIAGGLLRYASSRTGGHQYRQNQ